MFARTRDPLLWLVAAAIAALVLAVAVPALVLDSSIRLSTNRSYTATYAPAPALILDHAQEDAQHITLKVEQQVTTSANERSDAVATADAILKLIDVDNPTTPYATMTDSVVLSRESTYPDNDFQAYQTVKVPGMNTGFRALGAPREGLQYFFPADTEQRSYPFYEPLTQDSAPVDYVDSETRDGVDVYLFHQELEAVPTIEMLQRLQQGSAELDVSMLPNALSKKGPAKEFYTPEELEHFQLAPEQPVELNPYYSLSRDLAVDPATGTIVDSSIDVYMVFATDAGQAADRSVDPVHRAIFVSALHWDDSTRAAALDYVRPTVRLHKAMGLFSWLARALAVLLLVIAAVRFVRRRG
ncbi:porin PorA family protein [Corynebacterium lizhenjunii]|uniref:porin PorA family protein n=1 Tax=Corynebacterium lizhenjunii TaxID=2709394 RepID=UPI0013ED9F03|nr:porin PorA family protein [Corynebacterium lizhenjunii]